MVWDPVTSRGNEAAKVRYEVFPYCKSGLDIGCGPSKVWPSMLGVDSGKDTALFGVAMKPDLVVNDAARLAIFADGSMPTVFSSHTLEHIENYHGALHEWWRLVKQGGHLILYLPHKNFYPNIGEPGANPDHKHDFLPADIIEAMRLVAADWTLLENQERNDDDEYSFLQIYRKEAAGHGQREAWAEPKPAKTAGVVRVGGHGDAIWASSPCALLKEQGYHVTVYTASPGAEVLKHDPNIDRIIALPEAVLTNEQLLQFWAYEARKYTKWVNLQGSVEGRLLAHVNETAFYLPHKLRHRYMNANYLETVHDYADLPHDFRQKFYPTEDELAVARQIRALSAGPLVVINPAGSGPNKYWPHSHRLMQLLAERGVYSVVLGDVAGREIDDVEPFGAVVGMGWPARVALTVAQLADAVVATESMIANAVAFEPMLKVITLSHSSAENLTKHWPNTVAIEPAGVACHPCHRIHPQNLSFCSKDKTTGAAACQAVATADTIAEVVIAYLERAGKIQKEAA